jgi:hypothetical protein
VSGEYLREKQYEIIIAACGFDDYRLIADGFMLPAGQGRE